VLAVGRVGLTDHGLAGAVFAIAAGSAIGAGARPRPVGVAGARDVVVAQKLVRRALVVGTVRVAATRVRLAVIGAWRAGLRELRARALAVARVNVAVLTEGVV